MNRLKEILTEGKHSLVIRGADGSLTTYDGRGVSDLYGLTLSSPDVLKGAWVADKVVGTGAAALMVSGGVAKVYAGVISSRALELFRTHHVEASFGKEVPNIINRAGTGFCPVEVLLDGVTDIGEMVTKIGAFVKNLKKSK